MKKRLALLCFLSLFLITTVTGCGSGGNKTIDSSNTSPAVMLTFISSWGGNDPNATAMQQILDKFCAENPNIKVSNQSVFGDDFLPYLKTAFVSGNDPDVFGLWPGSDIDSMISAYKVADITGLLDADPTFKDSFGTKMWQYVTYNNKIYGLPVEIIFEGLYVNKDLFDKYGVGIPKTFAELTQAVKVFNSNGITAIAYNDTAEGTYIYQNIAASIGGKSAIENPFSNGNINNCYIEAMKDMQTLYNLHAFPSDYLTIDSNERNDMFKDKKAAMIVQGSWYAGEVASDPNVEFVRFPNCGVSSEDSSRIIYGLGNGVFHISEKAWANSSRNQAAVKLLKFIASKQSALLLSTQTGMLSNVDIGNSISYDRLTLQGLALINDSKKELIGPPDSYITRPAWGNVIVNDFPLVLTGAESPEKIWSDAINDGAIEN